MKITELIAQHIIDVHEGGNWTDVDIYATLEDVSWREAVIHTPASPNTIASLVHHITFWNRVLVQRTQGIKVHIDDANGFNHPPLQSEEDWQHLKADNLQSAHELASAILRFDEAKLFEPIVPGHTTAYKNLQGGAEHVHYHLGQIVILKKFIRNMAMNEL